MSHMISGHIAEQKSLVEIDGRDPTGITAALVAEALAPFAAQIDALVADANQQLEQAIPAAAEALTAQALELAAAAGLPLASDCGANATSGNRGNSGGFDDATT